MFQRLTEDASISETQLPTPDLDSMAMFRRGFIDGFSLPAFMVAASMIGYGALVQSAGLSLGLAIVSTVGIWGLPGQVAFIEYILLGAPVLSMLIAVSMANMRFLPMSLSLIPMFRGSETGWRLRYLWVQIMSVNTWVGLLRKAPELTADQRGPYYAGFSTICLICGVLGSASGYLLADTLPFYVTVTMVFINPIYFAFVFAAMRARSCMFALMAGAITGPPLYLLSPEWSLPFCGLIAGTVGYAADRIIRRRA